MSQVAQQPSRPSRRRVKRHVAAAQPAPKLAKVSKSTRRAERLLTTIIIGCLCYLFYAEGTVTKILELLK